MDSQWLKTIDKLAGRWKAYSAAILLVGHRDSRNSALLTDTQHHMYTNTQPSHTVSIYGRGGLNSEVHHDRRMVVGGALVALGAKNSDKRRLTRAGMCLTHES